VRFTGLQKATYRDVIGVGSGVAVLRSTHADADFIDPLGEQYVRVVEETDAAETVVGGFWLSDTKHETAVQKDTLKLSVSGPATMAYLARSVMAPHTYIHAVFEGQDPYDDVWRLSNQSTFYANGSHLGAMLWRVIYEAQHFRSGAYTHRHKDGETYTDTHADDRLASAIPDLVMDFDQFVDSDGDDWTLEAGEFQAQVGENVLSVVQRLIQAGLYIEMDPDTFELRAWETRPASRGGRSTDRTGTSWATGTVLFKSPTGGDISTGNIKSDTERQEKSFLRRSVVWAGGGDVYAKETGSTDIPWEGFESANLNDLAALGQLAEAQINAREEAASAVTPKIRLGDDEPNGFYRPWQEVRLDDLVTVHTGSGQWDFDNQTFPVAGLRIEQKIGGDWAAWAELGASYEAGRERRFQVGPPASHSHPPNPELCRLGVPGTDSSTRLYFSLDAAVFNPAADAAWDDSGPVTRRLYTSPDGSYGTSPTSSTSSGDADGRNICYWRGVYGPLSADDAARIAAGGTVISGQMRVNARYGIGVSEAAQNMIYQVGVRVTQGATTTIRGTALPLHSLTSSAGSTKWGAVSSRPNRTLPAAAADDVLTAVPGTAAGDYLLIEVGSRNYTTVAVTGGGMLFTSNSVSDLPVDQASTAALNCWIQFDTSGVGAVGPDLPLDTVRQDEESTGTSIRAARCDHQHAHGLLSVSGTHYHDQEDIEGTTTFTLDQLDDVDLSTPPVDGDTLVYVEEEGLWIAQAPGKWEAVTNGEDIFVWEDDDLVHEWRT